MKTKEIHDPMCPVVAIHPWQICLCEAFELVRADERTKMQLESERQTNDLLNKIISRRDEMLREFWNNERKANAERIAEVQRRLDTLAKCIAAVEFLHDHDQCPYGSHPRAECCCDQIDAEIREHLADLEIDRMREEDR